MKAVEQYEAVREKEKQQVTQRPVHSRHAQQATNPAAAVTAALAVPACTHTQLASAVNALLTQHPSHLGAVVLASVGELAIWIIK